MKTLAPEQRVQVARPRERKGADLSLFARVYACWSLLVSVGEVEPQNPPVADPIDVEGCPNNSNRTGDREEKEEEEDAQEEERKHER